MASRTGKPTIKELPDFNAGNDADALRKAMRGLGTDEAGIIGVLSKRTARQRRLIARTFLASFGKHLDKELKGELSGRFEDLAVSSLDEAPTLNAKSLRKALEGAGTKENVLLQVLAIGSNDAIKATTTAYNTIYKRNLEKDICGDTSGNFEKILVALMQGLREEEVPVDLAAAQVDAEALYQSGEGRRGTEEAVFTRIFAQRSFPQISEIAKAYQQKYGKPLATAIKKETSGYYEDTMVAIVEFAQNGPSLLAKWFHNSMAGAGTNDNDLIRLTLTRADVDLEDIKQAYLQAYGKSLESAVEGDTSGDYKRLLLAIVRGN